MKRHTTDEGWQVMAGLEHSGYRLCGRRLSVDEVDVLTILRQTEPGIVVVQDKREWDVARRCFRDRSARFNNVQALASRPDIFCLTILKDAHQNPAYHSHSSAEMGVHAWIIYYNPKIVCYLAPFIRPQHLIRTYHSIDAQVVPAFSVSERRGCLLSGAVSGAYPLRAALIRQRQQLPEVTYLAHPRYHARGCMTPEYLKTLSRFKVAICTASRYGYALRKIIEATASGCAVVTDLPTDEVLPEIDGNLVRIPPVPQATDLRRLLLQIYADYDAQKQRDFAERAKDFYDYRNVGSRLATDIDTMRQNYSATIAES
jgi:hypothetical protein